MLKRISLIFLGCLFVFQSGAFAEEAPIAISGTVYLDIFEDGKMVNNKIIASPLIHNLNGQLEAYWEHIYITPWEKSKDVSLKMERWSSVEGNIRGIRIHPDHTVTFQIQVVAAFDLKSNRIMNVFLKLSDDNREILDVSSNMTYWSNIANSKIVIEWKRSKQSKVELPYKTVF